MQQSLSGLGTNNESEPLSLSLRQLIITSGTQINALRHVLGEGAEVLAVSLGDPTLCAEFENSTIGLDAAFCLGLSRDELQDFSDQDLVRLLALDSAVFPLGTRPYTAYALLEDLPAAATLPSSIGDKMSALLARRLRTVVGKEDDWRRAPTADVNEVQTILSILAKREDLQGSAALREPELLKAIQIVLWPCFEQRNRLDLKEQTNKTIRQLYPRDAEHHAGISAVLHQIDESRTYAGVLRFSEVKTSLEEVKDLGSKDTARIALMMLAQKFYDGVINREVSKAVNELLRSRKEAIPHVVRELNKDLRIEPTSQDTTVERVEYELPRLYHSAKVLVEASRELVDKGNAESFYLKEAIPELIIYLVTSLKSNIFRSAKADLFAAVSELPGEWLTQRQLFVLGQKLFRDSGPGIAIAGKLVVQKLFFGDSDPADKT